MKPFTKSRLLTMLGSLIVSMAGTISGASLTDTQSQSPDSAHFYTWNYGDTAMGLYVPASHGKKLPVVMFLHGCHNDPVSSDLWIINKLNSKEPCAVFIPTAPPELNTQYSCADWGGTYDGPLRANMKKALYVFDSLKKEFEFDTTRMYLYGESMGGEGVYRLLQDFPAHYAGAVITAGYTVNKSAEKMAKTPLWIFHSADDEVSGVDNARTIYQSIQTAGGTLTHYTEYEGLNHSESIQKVRTEDSLFVWLLKQVRSDSSGMEPVDSSKTFFTWTYKNAEMGLYLPKSTNKPLPVVMYLHYCTGTPVYPEFWIVPALNAIEPCAVFLPTAPPEQNTQYSCADWGGTYDQSIRSNMVNALHELDSLITRHGFDVSRLYLYGESMGGEGVYRLLMDFPTRFAGGVVASGYTVNKGAEQMAKTPLWIFHGSDDQLSSVDNARTIFKAIKDAGGTLVKYTEYEGYDHTPAMNHVHDEEGLLEWLLSQKRSTAVIRQSRKAELTGKSDLIYCKSGNLVFNYTVPPGSILTLLNLNGKVLYETVISGSTVTYPSTIKNRVVMWRVSHNRYSMSGRIMPLGR